MAKKRWKEWQLVLNGIEFKRLDSGQIIFSYGKAQIGESYVLSPQSVRHLFQKLSGDYKD